MCWIIPSNHPLSSAFAQGFLASKEDWKELSEISAFSLTVKSKPSSVQTWLQGWKRVYWRQPLSGRMLKRSLQKDFTERFTASLEAIPVNPSAPQGKEKDNKIHDTFGRIYASTSLQSDLFGVSSKTSQVISRWDSKRFTKSWQKWVTELRQESLRRRKLARLTEEKGFSFLQFPTPRANKIGGYSSPDYRPTLEQVVLNWPTATAMDTEQEPEELLKRAARMKLKHNGKNGTTYSGNGCGMSLGTAVKNYSNPWPPASARDWKDSGREKAAQVRNSPCLPASVVISGQQDQTNNHTNGKSLEQLNPAWVAQFMGTATEKIFFVPLVTQSWSKQQN